MSSRQKKEDSYISVMSSTKPILDPDSETTIVEMLEGIQYVSPRPATPHAEIISRLGSILTPPYSFKLGGPGGWYILDKAEIYLGPRPDIVVPDLAGWRLSVVTEEMRQAVFVQTVPNWICEVLSPATVRFDRGLKLTIYAREGVEHVWLIDPQTQMIEVFRLEQGRYSLLGAYLEPIETVMEPFGPVRLDLLFGPLPRP